MYSPQSSPPVSPTHTMVDLQYPSHRMHSGASPKTTASAKRQKFLRRLIYFKQMDFEYAFWQMIYLFIAPQKVYRNFQYRKETKDQFARDDPAFLVLLSVWLIVSSVGFAFVLGLSFAGFIKFILWVVLVDCIAVGIVVASIFWFVTNKYMCGGSGGGQGRARGGQDVEWGYCFDVHLNAFLPLLAILHFLQLFFLHHFILSEGILARVFGNTLWLVAVGYYIYITFLGYNSIPFVRNPQVLLYPMTGLLLLYVITIIFGPNLSLVMCNFYHFRAGHA